MKVQRFISAFPAAWYARYADLQVIPGRSILPEMDGDIAWLNHLREQILEQAPVELDPLPDGALYRAVIDQTGIHPHQLLTYWPGDGAQVMLDAWRTAS